MVSLVLATSILQTPSPTNWLDPIRASISGNKEEAADRVKKAVGAEELSVGANPRESGLLSLWAIKAPNAKSVEVTFRDPADPKPVRKVKLRKLTKDGLWASVVELPPLSTYLANYSTDGKAISGDRQVEAYPLNPYGIRLPGGLRGELRQMPDLESDIYPGTKRKWYVYLPPNFKANREHNLLVGQDAQWDKDWEANFLDNMAAEGKIPPTVGVFIEPGSTPDRPISNRWREYDVLSNEYVSMLEKEILPQVEAIAPLSKNPAKRAITGMSSGGICSFTAAWERPDMFGNVLSFIGSFTNIASGESKRDGGHNYPFLIRKTDKKPIRIFLQDGENDIDNDHGSWWLANLQMRSAFQYKGYDHVWAPGKGFHSSKHARSIFDQALLFWNKGSE